MLRQIVASVTVAAFASAGCGRTWPSTAPTVADPAFATRTRAITTVDILPLDLAVWTEAGVQANPDELRSRASTGILNTALDALNHRAYGVASLIDWNGEAAGTPVLSQHALLATEAALARYGATVEQQPGTLPTPALPVRLGQVTGADATLYVGGWAYVAAHHESTGEKIAEGVAIALVAVAVIAIVAAIVGDHGSSGSHGSHGSGGSGGGHAGHGASTPRSAQPLFHARTPRVGGAAIVDHHEEQMAELRDHRSTIAILPIGHDVGAPAVTHDHRSGTTDAPTFHDHRSSDPTGSIDVRDHRAGAPTFHDHRGGEAGSEVHRVTRHRPWFPDVDADIDLDPTWQAQPAQDLGHESELYLEMTLVDNHTGRVLWHTHQVFPASAAKAGDPVRAARLLLASLPGH